MKLRGGNRVEIDSLESLLSRWRTITNAPARVELLDEVKLSKGNETLPIYGLVLGPDDKSLPTFGVFGGVHGLERVGTHVALNFLAPLVDQLRWDTSLQRIFSNDMRMVAIPIVNPGGMFESSRSNPRGIDIMRNAPIEAHGKLQPVVSGHRISPKLPWYRGEAGAEMEVETLALIKFVENEMLESDFSMAIDIHSGFGVRDRLWWPFSSSDAEFPYIGVINRMREEMQLTHPFHFYVLEPQHQSYLIHGDPWDLLFNRHAEKHASKNRMFIPWCLEMGSWAWLKKNPRQLFLAGGIFNPILPHRYGRIMRRHRPMLEMMKQMTLNHKNWRHLPSLPAKPASSRGMRGAAK